MKLLKLFWSFLWIFIVITFGFVSQYIPNSFLYVYGFLAGSASFVLLQLKDSIE